MSAPQPRRTASRHSSRDGRPPMGRSLAFVRLASKTSRLGSVACLWFAQAKKITRLWCHGPPCHARGIGPALPQINPEAPVPRCGQTHAVRAGDWPIPVRARPRAPPTTPAHTALVSFVMRWACLMHAAHAHAGRPYSCAALYPRPRPSILPAPTRPPPDADPNAPGPADRSWILASEFDRHEGQRRRRSPDA